VVETGAVVDVAIGVTVGIAGGAAWQPVAMNTTTSKRTVLYDRKDFMALFLH
jgi:hypothetical protein